MHPIDQSHKRQSPPPSIESVLSTTQRKVLRVSDRFLSPAPSLFLELSKEPFFENAPPSFNAVVLPLEETFVEKPLQPPPKPIKVFPEKGRRGLKLDLPLASGFDVSASARPPVGSKRDVGLTISLDSVSSGANDGSYDDRSFVRVNKPLGQNNPQICSWIEQICKIFEKDFFEKKQVRPSFLSCASGVCGSYFVFDEQERILAIVKPADEEPGAKNARKDLQLLKDGIQPMTASCREALAYRLAPEIVPPTVLMDLTSQQFVNEVTKRCSVQMFRHHSGSAHALDEGKKRDLISHLQATMFLDLFLFNSDRHAGNLLVGLEGNSIKEVIPIDHGCILPDNLVSASLFFWYPLLDPAVRFIPEIQNKIDQIDLESLKRDVLDFELGEGVINALNATILLLKKMHKTQSIRQIAMYYIAEPQNWDNSRSVLFYILRLAALRAGIELKTFESQPIQIPPAVLSSTVEEVVDFIESQRDRVDASLFCAGYEGKNAQDFLEKRYTGPDQKIHLAVEVTRKFLHDKFGLLDSFNPFQKNLFCEDILTTKDWQKEAQFRIEEVFQDRLAHPDASYVQPEALF